MATVLFNGKSLLLTLLATSIAAAQATPARPLQQPQQPSRRIQLMIDQWMRAKNWTHQYIEAMPGENSSFKPVPDVRSLPSRCSTWRTGIMDLLQNCSEHQFREQKNN